MLNPRSRVLWLVFGSVILFFNGIVAAQEPVDIQINFTGDQSFQALFDNAALIWEAILPSYQDGFDDPDPFQPARQIGPVVVDAGVFSIDNAGGVLAQAGPNNLFVDDSGFVLTRTGTLQFDTDDIDTLESRGSLQDIIVHELAHVLGFGTLWDNNNSITNNIYDSATSSGTTVGQYTGAAGVAAYNTEFGLNEFFIPVENNGGSGTADAHFDEELFGVAINGDSTVATGRRFGPNEGELLTGTFRQSVPTFLSDTTAATFEDIGFVVDFAAVEAFNNGEFDLEAGVPEPSSASLLLLTLAAYGFRRRRS